MDLRSDTLSEAWHQRLRSSRDSLAARWSAALVSLHPALAQPADIQSRIAAFVEVLLALLLDEHWHQEDAEDLGDALARMGFTHPNTLTLSSDLWIKHMESIVDESVWPSLLKRTTQVTSLFAVGFYRQALKEASIDLKSPANATIEALLENHTRLRATFEGIHVGMCFVDLAGRVLATNRALENMLGYSEHELYGSSLTYYTHPDDITLTLEHFEELRTQQRHNYVIEKRYLCKNGQTIWARLTVSLIDDMAGWDPFIVGILEDITEQKKLEFELEEIKRSLDNARESERLRLAQELHDGPVQQLLGVSYHLDALNRHIATSTTRAASSHILAQVQLLSNYVLDSVEQLRGLISELRPIGLLELGLSAAIEGFVERLHREFAQKLPNISLHLDQSGTLLPASVALVLFRIVQEGLRNTIRHANAMNVVVTLHISNNSVALRIRDDGRGFVVPATINELTRQNHFGIAGIIERVTMVNGTWSIVSRPGGGTEISVRVPYQIGENEQTLQAETDE